MVGTGRKEWPLLTKRRREQTMAASRDRLERGPLRRRFTYPCWDQCEEKSSLANSNWIRSALSAYGENCGLLSLQRAEVDLEPQIPRPLFVATAQACMHVSRCDNKNRVPCITCSESSSHSCTSHSLVTTVPIGTEWGGLMRIFDSCLRRFEGDRGILNSLIAP